MSLSPEMVLALVGFWALLIIWYSKQHVFELDVFMFSGEGACALLDHAQ
jgi:hypothetical protein